MAGSLTRGRSARATSTRHKGNNPSGSPGWFPSGVAARNACGGLGDSLRVWLRETPFGNLRGRTLWLRGNAFRESIRGLLLLILCLAGEKGVGPVGRRGSLRLRGLGDSLRAWLRETLEEALEIPFGRGCAKRLRRPWRFPSGVASRNALRESPRSLTVATRNTLRESPGPYAVATRKRPPGIHPGLPAADPLPRGRKKRHRPASTPLIRTRFLS